MTIETLYTSSFRRVKAVDGPTIGGGDMVEGEPVAGVYELYPF